MRLSSYELVSRSLADRRVVKVLPWSLFHVAHFFVEGLRLGIWPMKIPSRAWLARRLGISESNLSDRMRELMPFKIFLPPERVADGELWRVQHPSLWRLPTPDIRELVELENEMRALNGVEQLELLAPEKSLGVLVAEGEFRSSEEFRNLEVEMLSGARPASGCGSRNGAGFPVVSRRAGRQNDAPETGPSLEALALASSTKYKAEAKADLPERLWHVIGREMEIEPQYRRQWEVLVRTAPVYVEALLEKLVVARKEEKVCKPAAWMSRIARDDGRWPR